MFRKLSPIVVALVAGGLVLAGAAPAGAKVVDRSSFEDSGSGTNTNFCGAGISVDFTFQVNGSSSVKMRGQDGPLWFHDRTSVVNTFTYNGMTVTEIVPNTLSKDLKIVDNGDGTIGVTALLTGGTRVIGSDGKIIAKNDGQVRLLFTIDIATDTVIDEELIFGSTGTNADFCEVVLDHWGLL